MTEREALPAPASPHAADLPRIRQVLVAVALPLAGVETQFPDAYVVYRRGEAVVGVAGLERYGATGLLRSVAVLPSHQGAGLGRELVENRLRYARDLGLRDVFLLTTSAPTYFSRFGFVPAERASAPAPLQESLEFSSICPSSAACLVRRL